MCIAVPYLCWFLLSIAATYLPEGPLRTAEGLQRAAQELEAVYALHSDSELKERGLPIALRMKEMYQQTKEETGQPSTDRAFLFAKAFFVTCYVNLLDSNKKDWVPSNDCAVLKDLAPNNHRSLYLYAWAHLRAIRSAKLPTALDQLYPVVNALSDAIAILESEQPIVPILPYRDIVDKADIYLHRAYCYIFLHRKQQAAVDIAIAKQLGNKEAALLEGFLVLVPDSAIYNSLDDALRCSPASILKKANPPDTVRLPHHTHRRIDLCGNPKIGGNRAPIPRARIIDECSRGT